MQLRTLVGKINGIQSEIDILLCNQTLTLIFNKDLRTTEMSRDVYEDVFINAESANEVFDFFFSIFKII